jgi:hypothetical protein
LLRRWLLLKYKYTGEQPVLLIEFHKEVRPGDVVDVDGEINNVFFVPLTDDKKKEKDKDLKEAIK